MVKQKPALFSCNIGTNLEPTLDWLKQHFDLDDDVVSKMVRLMPAVLCCSIDTNLEPKQCWLQQHLGLDDAKVSKMIQRLPTLFNNNTDANLGPALEFHIHTPGNKVGVFERVVQTY